MRLAHPPVTFRHEKLKVEERLPAARRYIAEHRLNEWFAGRRDDVGLIVQGGLYNSLIRALQLLGLADAFGSSELPILALNVTFPLVPEEIARFCAGKRAVLVLEEGQPEYIERDILGLLHRHDVRTPLHGKDLLPATGEYTVEVMAGGHPRQQCIGDAKRSGDRLAGPVGAALGGAVLRAAHARLAQGAGGRRRGRAGRRGDDPDGASRCGQ